jgi:hypothetical protein
MHADVFSVYRTHRRMMPVSRLQATLLGLQKLCLRLLQQRLPWHQKTLQRFWLLPTILPQLEKGRTPMSGIMSELLRHRSRIYTQVWHASTLGLMFWVDRFVICMVIDLVTGNQQFLTIRMSSRSFLAALGCSFAPCCQ